MKRIESRCGSQGVAAAMFQLGAGSLALFSFVLAPVAQELPPHTPTVINRTPGIRLQDKDDSKATVAVVLDKEVRPAALIPGQSTPLSFDLGGRQLYNRPLYGSEPPFVTFGGSLPALAVSGGWYGGKLGNLHLVITTQDGRFAAHEAEHVKASYDGLALRYEIRDPRLKKGILRLEVFPSRQAKGCLAHLVAENLPAKTSVAWVYGGASGQYDFKYPSNYGSKTPILPLGPEHRHNNTITLVDDGFVLRGVARKAKGAGSIPNVVCAPVSRLSVEPARNVEFVEDDLADKTVSSNEATLGRIVVLKDVDNGQSWLRITEGDSPRAVPICDDIDNSLQEGRRLLDSFKLQTPDPELNLVSQLAIPAYRAVWWNNDGTHIALHGATAWAAPYLGWRCLYGAITLGWDDFLREDFRAHGAHQASGAGAGGGFPSLYFSRDWSYNMDEVFVHQLFHYYDWSGDADLIRNMWPRIEQNLKFRKAKLDPDNDCLYTSWLNTWISDYHWYLGGKCTQSSAYHYDAFRQMAETATLVGRDPAPFAEEAKRIREGMDRELWLEDQGVYAEYKDTIGLQRQHRSVELPTIYHPIEVGLASPERAARMAAFVRDTFEHIKTPGNGLISYSSPWRPTDASGVLHSSRDRCPNETLHMGLAAYQAGLDEYANRLLRGVCYSVTKSVTAAGSLCNKVDDQGHGQAHPDFADTTSLFFRTVAEGLFGIQPAVPKGKVRFAPLFPREWDHASLSTGGFTIEFKRTGLTEAFSFKTDRKLDYEIRLPLRFATINTLTVNGVATDYVVEAEVGAPRIRVRIPSCHQAQVLVAYPQSAAIAKAVPIATRPLEWFLPRPQSLPAPDRATCHAVVYNLDPHCNKKLEKVFEQKYSSSAMGKIHWMDVRSDSGSRWDRKSLQPTLEKLHARLDDRGQFVTANSKTQFRVAMTEKNVLLLGRWDELPKEVRVPVATPRVREVCLLIVGRTYPMQSHIANARIVLHYQDGASQPTDLINPWNYDDSIGRFGDYHYSNNEMVELGQQAHADVISLPADPGRQLVAVEAQCLSDQILFGVMAITLYQEQ